MSAMNPESVFQNNAVFFVEVEKVRPNPFQPRKEFDEAKLRDLADSIRMYGVLQPLVVTRKEFTKDDGGIGVEYELIAGERRLRASRLAGLREVPALIRSRDEDDRVKLELAIIENLQREDLNPIDRARSFAQLAEQFGLKHTEIAQKVGKSREYVSNTMRLLALPEEILNALSGGKISEGHARPLLMLTDRPEEQNVLFREIMLRKLTVRDAEKIARKIAFEKVRKKERMFDPDIVELEQQVSDTLGTRVHIEQKQVGGRIQIDYFNEEDLKNILAILGKKHAGHVSGSIAEKVSDATAVSERSAQMATAVSDATPLTVMQGHSEQTLNNPFNTVVHNEEEVIDEAFPASVEVANADAEDDEEETYSLNSFTI